MIQSIISPNLHEVNNDDKRLHEQHNWASQEQPNSIEKYTNYPTCLNKQQKINLKNKPIGGIEKLKWRRLWRILCCYLTPVS